MGITFFSLLQGEAKEMVAIGLQENTVFTCLLTQIYGAHVYLYNFLQKNIYVMTIVFAFKEYPYALSALR